MPLHFLLDDPLSAAVGDDVVLTGAEAHHAATVRRVRAGEQVTLGDGRGAWLTGECIAVAAREVVVRVTERVDAAPPATRLVLVQALAKGDRDELAVQAATELGVDEIVPWQAARSVSRWDAAKAEKGRARWGSIVREAAKQAHRAWVPRVTELTSTTELVARAAAVGPRDVEGTGPRPPRVLVLEPTAADRLSEVSLADADEVVLVVGPEGGIAAEELAALVEGGATLVRLGETVLRTSTAGPAALSVVSVALGRW